jgi:hypothetical protein
MITPAKIFLGASSDSPSGSHGGERRLTRRGSAGRSRVDVIIVLTVLGWLSVTLSYLCWWMMTGEWEYEGVWILPLLGFVVYRLPVLLVLLFVVVATEILFIHEPEKTK